MLVISPEWLIKKFPELDLIEDYSDPSQASLDFFLAQQTDARIGFLPSNGGVTGGHFNRDTAKLIWPALKAQFRDFLCTDSHEYAALRAELRNRAEGSEAVILSSITAAVAAILGAAVATLVPLVAICLYAVARLGAGAYCRLSDGMPPR